MQRTLETGELEEQESMEDLGKVLLVGENDMVGLVIPCDVEHVGGPGLLEFLGPGEVFRTGFGCMEASRVDD